VTADCETIGILEDEDDDEHEDDSSISEFRLKDRRYLIPRRITKERVPTMCYGG
jgi:hypothetical protein